MGVYIYQNGTEKGLKNAYIGEYKEQVFTIDKFGNSTSGVSRTQSIYMSGCKVVRVEIDSAITPGSNTSYGATQLYITNSQLTEFVGYSLAFGGSVSVEGCAYYRQIHLQSGDWQIKSAISPIFDYTTGHFVITPDYMTIQNGTGTINDYYTQTGDDKAAIERIFGKTDINIFLQAIYPYLGPTTVKVIYESI